MLTKLSDLTTNATDHILYHNCSRGRFFLVCILYPYTSVYLIGSYTSEPCDYNGKLL